MRKIIVVVLLVCSVSSCTYKRRVVPEDRTPIASYQIVTPSGTTEEYAALVENDFRSTATQPLSTFSVDVDKASYANVRRFINDGSLPPAEAVRVEELVNYFTYDYPQPAEGYPFSIVAEAAPCPWNPDHRLVQIGIQGKRMDMDELPPNNLVFLIDCSGSMSDVDKLPLIVSAMRLLVNELRPRDRVAIVTYSTTANLALESTSGRNRAAIFEALERLNAEGSTAGAAGIQRAYQVAQDNFVENGNNRIILATDGDFNVGISSDVELERLITQKRDEGVFLTVLGFGQGNLKDKKMEMLADLGNGNYSYIDNILEARKTLVRELGATLFTIAKDVKLQVEFNPERVSEYRLIGYENRLLRSRDFDNDKKDAGEIGAGHSVTALYEVVPVDVDSESKLRYERASAQEPGQHSGELMLVKLRYKNPDEDVSRLIELPVEDMKLTVTETTDDFRFAAAVAEFGLLLRESDYRAEASYADALALAGAALGEDESGDRHEFVRLVELVQLMSHDASRP